MHIYRELLDKIEGVFSSNQPKGVILTGIVGCGKTTLIEAALKNLSPSYRIFKFSGDDSVFRRNVAEDSKYILNAIRAETAKRSLVFVDEVQKSEAVFDALKIIFDETKSSFIVSGSNPQYLCNNALKRMQRRAEIIHMLPLSLSELMVHQGLCSKQDTQIFNSFLFSEVHLNKLELPKIDYQKEITQITEGYFDFGGLPLAYLEKTAEEKLKEIRLTVERGFDVMSNDQINYVDFIRNELAQLHSKEFSYQGLFQKTRLRKRDVVNSVIQELIDHGYLCKKKPELFTQGKTSYLTVFSFVDPGIVTYLKGYTDKDNRGSQTEGYIHARLNNLIKNTVYKSTLSYFKEYDIASTGMVRYTSGEIDFIITQGKKIIPIEVKHTKDLSQIKTDTLESFIHKQKCHFGIVIYGGVPFVEKTKRLVFWPYWMV